MKAINLPKTPTSVAKVFSSYPKPAADKLKQIRQLILQTAASIEAVGPIEETLKWGEPAYLTSKSKSGSTIRIAWKSKSPDEYALYFNCNTTLVDSFRTLFPELKYEGNRALVFPLAQQVPKDTLRACIEMALTYHLNKRSRRTRRASN